MTRILVIDDEVQIRELLRKVLSSEGFIVTTVPTARQALERITAEPFDLVLTDIGLPDESGLSVLKKIRALDTALPVIIYSGAVTADLEKEARAAGASEVLGKTAGIATLTSQIKKFIKASSSLTAGQTSRKERKILVVDDEESVRNMTSKFFKDKGYKVLEARNGEEALSMASSHQPSVVLLDIKMPGMDGLATLEKLREAYPKLGVVMATGNEESEDIKRALRLGAYGYVLKPFDFPYLELVVLAKLTLAERGD